MVESIRFSGLASGMDTQSIIDSLMKAERIPLDNLNQKKQLLEWKRDDYRDMNKLLDEFDQFIFDGIYRQANMLTRTATSSIADVVTATAAPNAGTISYKIENVTLATAARMQSTQAISTGTNGKIDSSMSLWSQRDKFEGFTWQQEEVTNAFTVPVNGASEFQLSKGAISNTLLNLNANGKFEVTKKDGTVQEFTAQIGAIPSDSATRDPDTVYIDENTGKMVFGTKLEEGSTFTVKYSHNYLEFNIETYNEDGTTNKKETDFKIAGTTSLDSMLSQINSSNVGINMFYDSWTDQVVVQRKETGKLTNDNGNSFNFTGASSDFFTTALKFADGDKYNEQSGTNAVFTINGLETQRTSNTFTMNGVTFTLHNNLSGQAATINVSTNTDEIINTVKDFVNKYNELIEKVNGKLTEERYSDYTPLTDEQKDEMSEQEIEKWEEKAKSGMLKRDQILSSALSRMRTDLYSEVTANDVTLTDKNYNQLAEIGITTTSSYLDGGKLEIDEDKLREALENNPEAVYQLFMADGDSYGEKGLARRLRDTIDSTIGSIEERAGNSYKTAYSYTMGKQLLDLEDQIDRYEQRLTETEERYWSQFNAMESAMQKLNEQSNMLYSYLGMDTQK